MLSAYSRLQPSPNLGSITLSLTGSRSRACIAAMTCSTGWFVNLVFIVFLRLTSFEKQAEQSRKGWIRSHLSPQGFLRSELVLAGGYREVESPPLTAAVAEEMF